MANGKKGKLSWEEIKIINAKKMNIKKTKERKARADELGITLEELLNKEKLERRNKIKETIPKISGNYTVPDGYDYGGVYHIKNKKNGTIYIGQSVNIKERWLKHLKFLVSNSHRNKQMQDDFNTYGLESFEFKALKPAKYTDILEFMEYEVIFTIRNLKFPMYNKVSRKDEVKYSILKMLITKGSNFKYQVNIQISKTHKAIFDFVLYNANKTIYKIILVHTLDDRFQDKVSYCAENKINYDLVFIENNETVVKNYRFN